MCKQIALKSLNNYHLKRWFQGMAVDLAGPAPAKKVGPEAADVL